MLFDYAQRDRYDKHTLLSGVEGHVHRSGVERHLVLSGVEEKLFGNKRRRSGPLMAIIICALRIPSGRQV